MLYGGSKEAYASVSKDAQVMLKLGSTPDKREQHRLMRDAMEKRFVRVTRGWLHLKLVEKANGGKLYTTTEEAKSGIASAVENLEGKLSKRA